MGLSRAPHRTDQRVEHVIHHHAPPRDESNARMNFLSDVSECRTRARIRPRHSSVADPRKQHRHHRDQDRRYYVASSSVAQDAVDGHRRHRLNYDDAIQNQIPERQCTPQAWRGSRRAFVAQAILPFAAELRFQPGVTLACCSDEFLLSRCPAPCILSSLFNRFNADSVRNLPPRRNC